MTTTTPESEGSQALVSSSSPAHQAETSPLSVLLMLDIPFVSTPPVRCSLPTFIVGPMHKKQSHSPSIAPCDQCNKWTHVNSQEVKVRSEHNSMKDDEDLPEMVLEAGPSYDPWRHGPISLPSSPTNAPIDPDEGIVADTLRNTGDQDSENNCSHHGVSSDQNTSRENVAESDLESTSEDCLTCLDMDKVIITATQMNLMKNVQASCSLAKGCPWSEAQLKQIGDSYHVICVHDHWIVRLE